MTAHFQKSKFIITVTQHIYGYNNDIAVEHLKDT